MGKNLNKLYLLIIKNLSAEMRVIYLYRYFSLVMTSVFYLTGRYNTSWIYGLTLVGCLTVAALVLNYIYIKYEDVEKLIKLIITVETISNIVILIPTGGLNSPYIWYSLNTVLITAYYLNLRYFYLNLFTYTTILAVTSFYIFNKSEANLISFFRNNSNLILSYMLIIFAIKILMKLAKKLNQESQRLYLVNEELSEANKMIEEAMEYVSSLYQTIDNIINIGDKNKLIAIIAEYAKNINRTPLALLYISSEKNEYIIKVDEEPSEDFKELLFKNIKQNWDNIINSDEPLRFCVNDRCIAAVSIKSLNKTYGILGIEINNQNGGIIQRENMNQIKLLASLSAILFERFKIEEMNRVLLIAEEQNRIANEIHDSVSQRLFFISCKVHSIIQRSNKTDIVKFQSELNLIKDSINSAMQELKEVIYSYSRKRDEFSTFEKSITNYVNETSQLNGVNISFNIIGNQELINYNLKKVTYRILCEGIGNAIRHGKSENINAYLYVEKEHIKLQIDDDGIGFDMQSTMAGKSIGLGIKNLHNLVYSFNGDININSQTCKGTSINILLPNVNLIKKEQEDVI